MNLKEVCCAFYCRTGLLFKVKLAAENSAARLFQGEEAFVKMKEKGLLEIFFLYFLPII